MIMEVNYWKKQTKPTHLFTPAKPQTKALWEALSPEKAKTGVSASCQSQYQDTDQMRLTLPQTHMAWSEGKVEKTVNQMFASNQGSIFLHVFKKILAEIIFTSPSHGIMHRWGKSHFIHSHQCHHTGSTHIGETYICISQTKARESINVVLSTHL